MRRLGRLFGGSDGLGHHHSDEPIPGWDAINAALEPIYRDQEPVHWGTVVRWRMGGPDPLDGTSAYRADGPPTHWHFVSYGLSELYRKETDDLERSGFGIELTFRLRREPVDGQPPIWAVSLLQNLARYVFESGNVLNAGDHLDLNGPIALEETTAIRAIALATDPQLGAIDTPHGRVTFIQIVGLTLDEYEAIQAWDTNAYLELIAETDPLLVTDLRRTTHLDDPAFASLVRHRTEVEGSSMGQINVDRLGWSIQGSTLTVTIGAAGLQRMQRMIRGRLPFGNGFIVSGQGSLIAAQPADRLGWHDAGDGAIHIELPRPIGERIVDAVPVRAGAYDIDARLRILVEPTVIRDQAGEQIEVIG